jgi:hypothetical protein
MVKAGAIPSFTTLQQFACRHGNRKDQLSDFANFSSSALIKPVSSESITGYPFREQYIDLKSA